MLLIDQEHFCWTQAVLHADSDLPSIDFNSWSSQCLRVHRGRRETNESRDYWLLCPRLRTVLFFILVQYFNHSSVNVWTNKLSRPLPMTSPKTQIQNHGKWTMKHLGAMQKLPDTWTTCVCMFFCSSSLHVGQQGVPTQGLCTSPRTTVFSPLQQTFHFMLKSQIGLELHDMNHPYCQNSQMLQDLVLSSQGFVALPCQMKPVLPAGSFTQIPAEEDSLTPNCRTVPSQFCIFLPPQGKVFVSLLSQCF